jgi:hypothetical protein
VSQVPKIRKNVKPIEPLPPKPTGATVVKRLNWDLKSKRKLQTITLSQVQESTIMEKMASQKYHIESVTKKDCFTNIDRTSARSRNNTRTSLSSHLLTLEKYRYHKRILFLK